MKKYLLSLAFVGLFINNLSQTNDLTNRVIPGVSLVSLGLMCHYMLCKSLENRPENDVKNMGTTEKIMGTIALTCNALQAHLITMQGMKILFPNDIKLNLDTYKLTF